jgi:hypothetical protein
MLPLLRVGPAFHIVGRHQTRFTAKRNQLTSSTRTGLTVKLPIDLDGRSVDPNLSSYSVELRTKILTRGTSKLLTDAGA